MTMTPTPYQTLLLQAALWQDERAQTAWNEWKAHNDIDDIDIGSYRLLPLVYHNLKQLQVTDPLMSRLKGVYRHTWYNTQTLFHTMGQVMQALHAKKIEGIVLKGAVLTIQHYKDYGLRPMDDFDLLVRSEHVVDTLAIMYDLGMHNELASYKPHQYISKNSLGLVTHTNRGFDLHWRVLKYAPIATGIDDDFWHGAIPITIQGQTALALNPTDLLLHVCIHGIVASPAPPFRWVADAITILRTAEIDWHRLMQQTKKRNKTMLMTTALSFLRDTMEAAVPMDVLQQMRSLPVSWLERAEYTILTTLPHPVAGWFPLSLVEYHRYVLASGGQTSFQPVGPLRFLLDNLNVENPWTLPVFMAKKMIERIGRTKRGIADHEYYRQLKQAE